MDNWWTSSARAISLSCIREHRVGDMAMSPRGRASFVCHSNAIEKSTKRCNDNNNNNNKVFLLRHTSQLRSPYIASQKTGQRGQKQHFVAPDYNTSSYEISHDINLTTTTTKWLIANIMTQHLRPELDSIGSDCIAHKQCWRFIIIEKCELRIARLLRNLARP